MDMLRDEGGTRMLTRRRFLKAASIAGASTTACLWAPLLSVSRAVAAAGALTYDPAQRYDLWVYDLEYLRVEGESLLVRIYEPQGTGPFPLLLDVHAGVWGLLDRTSSEPLDKVIASSGAVVAAIDYRLTPKYSYPASVADVNYATRWLKLHARNFHADPSVLGGIGPSAGGHLLMLSAMQPHDTRYAAIPLTAPARVDATVDYAILLSPILDPYARYLFAQKTGRADLMKLTDAYFHTVQAMKEGNPTRLLSQGLPVSLPPTLILQGTADKNVTPEMQEQFATAYRAAGGTVDLEIFANAPHLFALAPGPDTDRANQLAKAFVAAQIRRHRG